jgi:hypothetical protein
MATGVWDSDNRSLFGPSPVRLQSICWRRPSKEEYGFDPAMAAATNDLPLQMPRSMRTDLDEQRWKVPPSLSWVQLRDHLAAQLGRGWSIDKHFSEQGSGSLRTVWRYDGEMWWWEQPPVLFTWTFPPITTSPC